MEQIFVELIASFCHILTLTIRQKFLPVESQIKLPRWAILLV